VSKYRKTPLKETKSDEKVMKKKILRKDFENDENENDLKSVRSCVKRCVEFPKSRGREKR